MSVSVSIIVPCYNVAAYLDQCMESLAGQSMEDIEIICVNDGSSDRTAEILREWRNRDGRVRGIDRKNSGKVYRLCGPGRRGGAEYVPAPV